jgi:hypothetical protein
MHRPNGSRTRFGNHDREDCLSSSTISVQMRNEVTLSVERLRGGSPIVDVRASAGTLIKRGRN